jgi:hypothetical protein
MLSELSKVYKSDNYKQEFVGKINLLLSFHTTLTG